MKMKYFNILVFLFSTGLGFSQNLDFPEKDAVWKESHTFIAGQLTKFFAVCGDTTINGTDYSKVVALDVDDNLQIVGSTYSAAIRQDGPVVYVFFRNDPGEVVLYDFSLEAGDEIQLTLVLNFPPVTLTVEQVDTQMIAGKTRRVIHFTTTPPYCPEYWIEGIGSNFGLLGRALNPCLAADLGSQLLCFQYMDEYLNLTLIECFLPETTGCGIINGTKNSSKAEPLELTVSPNPASSSVRFHVNQNSQLQNFNLKIYAANGKLLHVVEQVGTETQLPAGVSLQKGFYIAVLENKHSGRLMGHATFVVQ